MAPLVLARRAMHRQALCGLGPRIAEAGRKQAAGAVAQARAALHLEGRRIPGLLHERGALCRAPQCVRCSRAGARAPLLTAPWPRPAT
jgi:hypothetical protein